MVLMSLFINENIEKPTYFANIIKQLLWRVNKEYFQEILKRISPLGTPTQVLVVPTDPPNDLVNVSNISQPTCYIWGDQFSRLFENFKKVDSRKLIQ